MIKQYTSHFIVFPSVFFFYQKQNYNCLRIVLMIRPLPVINYFDFQGFQCR